MPSASRAVMWLAAIVGILSVGAIAWRAIQMPTAPDTTTRPASPSNPVPAQQGSPMVPLSSGPPSASTTPTTPGQTAALPPSAAPGRAAPPASSEVKAPVASPPPPPEAPHFDVVRVEPTGDAVIAGRASPNSTVTIFDKGTKLAEVKADSSGAFAAIPPALPPGDHLLTLKVTGPAGEADSEQSVAVSVPDRAGSKVVAALTTPNEATRVLNEPAQAPAGGPQVAIRTVEAGQEGAFFASGSTRPEATVRLYLNGSFVAEVKAAADGKWTLKVEKGMAPGHYDVRADVLEGQSAKVAARAEVPFDYPVQAPPAALNTPAAAPGGAGTAASGRPAVAASAPAVTQPEAGLAIVREIQSVTVQRGDSLWRISRRVLGKGIRYTQIYEANTTQIRDPNRIWPGQVLVAPGKPD